MSTNGEQQPGLPLFDIGVFPGKAEGPFGYLPPRYSSLSFSDQNGNPLFMNGFIKSRFVSKLQDAAAKNPSMDSNGASLIALEQIVGDLRSTGHFKGCATTLRPNKQEIDLKLVPKGRFYFNMQQMFNAQGNITVTQSGGLRNLVGMLDSLTFSLEKSLQKDKLTQASANWSFPFWYGDTSLNVSYFNGSSNLDSHLIEKKHSVSVGLGLPGNSTSLKYSLEDRQNIFDPDEVSREVLDTQVLPSLVHKFELNTSLFKKEDQKLDLKLTQTFGDTQATSVELNHKIRKNMSKYLGKSLPAKYTDIELENAWAGKWMPLESGIPSANDRFHLLQLRGYQKVGLRHSAMNTQLHPRQSVAGFRHLGDHLGSRLAFRNTTKLVWSHLTPKTFFHYTVIGTSPEPHKIDLKTGIRMSAGLGLEVNYGGMSIELLYNFWHKTARDDQRNYFQVKFALDD